EDEWQRLVEPHQRVGAAENQVADLSPVEAVEHPTLRRRHGRLDIAPEVFVTRFRPPGLVAERIQLGNRQPKLGTEAPRKSGLAVPADSDDDDASPAQPIPRMNLASSDIRSGVHGGSQVSSMSTSSTPGISRAIRLMSSWIIGPAGQPIDVRLCVTFTRGP